MAVINRMLWLLSEPIANAGFQQKYCKKQPWDCGMLQTPANVGQLPSTPKYSHVITGEAAIRTLEPKFVSSIWGGICGNFEQSLSDHF